ncbi:MAG: ABC transporter ATP-binding protein/permease, partial [Lachnospiraceae bacterium]|nr:ABC transporter ATP-binding protein/permease [Lachnospiraceae bacterium]
GWLWGVVALYVIVFAAKALVSVFIKQVYNRIFPVMTLEAKSRVLEKYSELDMKVLSCYTAGELKERLHNDTENLVLFWEKRVELWIALISVPVMTGILLYLNWILAVVSFLLLPLSFYMTRYIKGRSNVEHERRREILGKYNDFMIHNMFFWKEVKTNCQEERQQQQFESLWKELGDAFLKSHIFWFLNRTFLAFKDVFLTKMGLYLLGGILVIKGMATVPALLAFMEYYADFVDRLLEISDIFMRRGEQEASIKRIREIMELQSPERIYSLEHFESVEFRNIGFSYETGQENIVQDCNMTIKRGETAAIMGESGCGKSTLIKMMAGFITPEEGKILWNGLPMEQINRQDIYARAGFLMQESALFNLTIRENLLFGRADAGEEELRAACVKANIMEFIQGLEQGFETVIGENGIKLSGGQKQRLLIARLFLQDTELIVFDEATSALDYQNESEILNLLLQEESKEKTFVMVTHRGTSVTRCSRVIGWEEIAGG